MKLWTTETFEIAKRKRFKPLKKPRSYRRLLTKPVLDADEAFEKFRRSYNIKSIC